MKHITSLGLCYLRPIAPRDIPFLCDIERLDASLFESNAIAVSAAYVYSIQQCDHFSERFIYATKLTGVTQESVTLVFDDE